MVPHVRSVLDAHGLSVSGQTVPWFLAARFDVMALIDWT